MCHLSSHLTLLPPFEPPHLDDKLDDTAKLTRAHHHRSTAPSAIFACVSTAISDGHSFLRHPGDILPKPGEIAYGRGSVAARGHCVAWINPVANAGEAFFRASAGVNPLRGVWDRVGAWVCEWFTHWTLRWPPVEGPGILAWARHLLKPLTLDTEQTRPINGRRQSKRTAMGLAGARIRVLSGAGGCPPWVCCPCAASSSRAVAPSTGPPSR